MELILYIDGASAGNPGDAGIGVVILNNKGNLVGEISQYLGKTTNNVAEYKALIKGLQVSKKLDATTLRLRSDSELLVKQITGQYKVRKPHLKKLWGQAKELMEQFEHVEINKVTRTQNKRADKLAHLAIKRGKLP